MALSEDLKVILDEFYAERMQLQLNNMVATEINSMQEICENWQISQFWYKKETSDYLAQKVIDLTNAGESIALIACPSIYISLKEANCNRKIKLFEIDTRFELTGDDYVYYDYIHPLRIPKCLKHKFDLVIVDPPFLSEECILKCSITAKFLCTKKVIVCSGTVMETFVYKFLKARPTNFKPEHKNLGNNFACYINFSNDIF